jgi:hypothetical protein
MMHSESRALRYAVLGALRSEPADVWTTDEIRAGKRANFERQIAVACEPPRNAGDEGLRRDGLRSMARTSQRIAARELEYERRTALDLQRLADLEDRRAQRRALALRQRWFVIGRIVEAAMVSDPVLRSAVERVLGMAKLRKDERDCLARE